MMPAIDQAILAISNSLAASIIVKATVVISLALITARLARSSRASVRHAILTAGFAVLFALPVATTVAPPIYIALTVAKHSSAVADNTPRSVVETSTTVQTSNDAAKPTELETMEFSFFDLLFAAWLIGAAIFLAPVIIGLWQVRSMRRTGLPWPQGNALATALANEVGLHRRVEVLLHESVTGPMTCGICRPAIVFPLEAENWNAADLNRAIAHELEHVRRSDWLTHCLARVVCAAYWFHPLVWIASRRLTLEAERACDDSVLSRSEATAYAEQLVALARHLTAANKSPLLAMANRSDLAKRITSVLDNRQRRGRTGFLAIAFACGVAALLIIALSPLKTIAVAQEATIQDWEKAAGGKMSFDVASVKQDIAGLPPSGPAPHSNFPLFAGNVFPPNGGRMSITNLQVQDFIVFAYKIMSATEANALWRQLPTWARTERFDIEAHAPEGTTKDQMRLMMQSLLADRFKFAMHYETHQQPVYSLVFVKPGKMGPNLRLYQADEPPCGSKATGATPTSTVAGGFPAICGGVQPLDPSSPGLVHLGSRNIPMTLFAGTFAPGLKIGIDRPMVDNTGINGNVDFVLEFSLLPGPSLDSPVPAETNNPPDVPPGPTFREAIKDQLGLKLNDDTAPIKGLVIDHVEPPTAN